MSALVALRRSRDQDEARRLRDLESVVRGEVRFSRSDRALYATDASNYRQPPLGVVIPRDAEDVVAAMEVCRGHDVPVLPRGGGTSLGGQCCNHAVMFDFGKYMRDVVSIDPDRRLATVQPGAVLDDLNARASRHGLIYGPDPATHDRCTIGGMLGNNACGVHALQAEFYGPGPRTEDHVHQLDVLTYDGTRMRVGCPSASDLVRVEREGGRPAEIHRDLLALRDRYADCIRERYPKIPRRVSGYALPELLAENDFHIARALVGSEATLAMVLEATVRLGTHFEERALLVLGYPNICAAADDVPRIRALAHKPVGLEGIDRMLTEYIRDKHMHPERLDLLPGGEAWLLVEFGGHDAEEARTYAEEARRVLTSRGRGPTAEVIEDAQQQDQLWRIRKSGLGATAFVPGRPDNWPGWEDSAVPVEHIGDYLRALHELFDRYDYQVSVYGHLGQGCVHCRVPFDLASEKGVREYDRFTREAAEIVIAHGGSLSGEHGDGQARGDLLPLMFGDELMEAMREMKRIWDPDGRMNPGKVIDADPRDSHLRLGPDYAPWEPDTELAFTEEDGRFSRAALRCVGIGACRRTEGGTMCPSFMVTREEMHSTRGRAHLLFELTEADILTDGWKSDGVKEALDLCLACKACKSECPVSVDMALYKAEFLSHYYRGRLRPRSAYAFGLVDRWARVGAAMPRLANWAVHAPVVGRVGKWLAGVAPRRDMPAFASPTFRVWHRQNRRPAARGDHRVMLWPDTFNDHFTTGPLIAALEVLEETGASVELPPRGLCCGRPLYDYGMLDRARRYLGKILDALEPAIADGVPIVGVEPSCIAVFRDELTQLFPDDSRAQRLSKQVRTLAEYLTDLDGWSPPRLGSIAKPTRGGRSPAGFTPAREGSGAAGDLDAVPLRALYHAHCHHQSVMGTDADRALLERMGFEVEAPDSGCCGMAGGFGFEAEHYDVSVACGERVLLPEVRERADRALVVTDGFSCREQIRQETGRRALHLGEVIRLASAAAPPRITSGDDEPSR